MNANNIKTAPILIEAISKPNKAVNVIKIVKIRPILAAKIFGALSIGWNFSFKDFTICIEIQLKGLKRTLVNALK